MAWRWAEVWASACCSSPPTQPTSGSAKGWTSFRSQSVTATQSPSMKAMISPRASSMPWLRALETAATLAQVAHRIAVDDLAGAVGRSVVDDEDLVAVGRVVLGDERAEAGIEVALAVAHGNDDRYEGKVVGVGRADCPDPSRAGVGALGVGALELGRPGVGGVELLLGEDLEGAGLPAPLLGLGVGAGEDVVEGVLGGLVCLGLGQPAAGGLHLADLLGEGALRAPSARSAAPSRVRAISR